METRFFSASHEPAGAQLWSFLYRTMIHPPIRENKRQADQRKRTSRAASSNNDVGPKNQKRAELLRSRIEELNRRLAILNSAREKFGLFEKPLDGVRRMDDSRSSDSPILWHRLKR